MKIEFALFCWFTPESKVLNFTVTRALRGSGEIEGGGKRGENSGEKAARWQLSSPFFKFPAERTSLA
jgi:hypothetical protein